jgi:Ser/Thr protein kinase RdoA (MazF antagonist)
MALRPEKGQRVALSEQLLERHWPLTEVSLHEVLQQTGDRVVKVICSREGRYVSKVSDQWRSREVAERHATLFDFLRERGFAHAPTVLKTRTGRNYCEIDGRYVYILEFIEGSQPERTRENYRLLGEVAGLLHTMKGYPHNYLFSVADAVPELYDLAQGLPFGDEYVQIVSTLPDFEHLPVSLIHGEILGNAIQKPDGTIVIVDWDEAGIGTRILDLGHPLIQVFISEDLEFDGERAHAFYRGYSSKVRLTDQEVDHVFDAGLFYALRYIVHGDLGKRWKRINFALRNRHLLMDAFRVLTEEELSL